MIDQIHFWVTPESFETVPDLSSQREKQKPELSTSTLMGRDYIEKPNIIFIGYENVEENPTYKTLLINHMHSHSGSER